MKPSKLICSSCHRHWTLKPRQKRTEACPRCRREHLSSAQIRAWDRRRRLEPRTGAVEETGPYLADSLARLMREADLASAKALAAALSISKNRPGRP